MEDKNGHLYTKIRIPELQPYNIIRLRLQKKLSVMKNNMVVLRGVAGYGKTVLLSQYVRKQHIACIWYNLSEEDNAEKLFVQTMIYNIKSVIPKFEFDLAEYLENQNVWQKYEDIMVDLVKKFCEFLQRNQHQGKIAVVFEDYQVVFNRKIDVFLKILQVCASEYVTLYITTSGALPDFIYNENLKDYVQVIQSEELSFDEAEAMELWRLLVKEECDKEYISYLLEYTQGWPKGLSFLISKYAEALKNGENRLTKVTYDERLFHYIRHEIFQKIPLEIQKAMRKAMIENFSKHESSCFDLMPKENKKNALAFFQLNNLIYKEDNGKCIYYKMLQQYLLYSYEKNKMDSTEILQKQVLEETSRKKIYVTCFSEFHAYIGEEKKEITWRTKKTAELFALFIKMKQIGRKRIFEYLWQEEFPNNAVALLHNMIYAIRKEVTGNGVEDIITYKKKIYYLNDNLITSDYEQICKICEAVKNHHWAELLKEEEMFKTYWGGYLEEFDSEWCIEQRAFFEISFVDGASYLGMYYWDLEQYEKALMYYKAAFKVSPYSEELIVNIMKCYGKLGRRKNVMKSYQSYCKILKVDFGLEPGEHLCNEYERNLRGETAYD